MELKLDAGGEVVEPDCADDGGGASRPNDDVRFGVMQLDCIEGCFFIRVVDRHGLFQDAIAAEMEDA